MTLKKYNQKRAFKKTPEPKGSRQKLSSSSLSFCIQKHDASHLHYDFRLEHKGVLLSWAVPKGPPLDPKDKRLAIQVEDHPFDYRNFEGIIPKGNYGAGTVMIWDEGTYSISGAESKKSMIEAMDAGLKKGHLEFILKGEKLQGSFSLIRMKNSENNWLLLTHRDLRLKDTKLKNWELSARSHRSLEEIAQNTSPKKRKNRKKLPDFISPMLATFKESAFDNSEWLFEIKWDGYRALAYVDSQVMLYSRNKNNFNESFPPLIEELEKIDAQCILDGEIVILDEKGKSDFQLMQNYQKSQKGDLYYYVFDLLYLNGEDLRELPLLERKEKLKTLLQAYPFKFIRFSDHIENKGISFFKKAVKYHLEGILAKKKDSGYRSIRSKEWFKIKTHYRQEAVIGGFTKPKGSRKYFGALLLGVYDKNKFVYIGHVGTGFSSSQLKDIYEQMLPLVVQKSPFDKKVKTNMPAVWVKPQLVGEVAFSEWTDDGIMRHPTFKGLRMDKKANQVKQELPQ